jgi:UDP-N-acetylglucosamine transferase subunit ALG13
MNGERLIFVTVGTEHYPFERLVGWVDGWLAERSDPRVQCVIQHGTSAAPAHAEASSYLEYDHVEKLMRDAAAVVCHGGTGSVMLARHLGKRPIVVPRERARGEHVDDHQVVLARALAARGEVVEARSRRDLHASLDAVVAGAMDLEITPSGNGRLGVARFAELVDAMLASKMHARNGKRR